MVEPYSKGVAKSELRLFLDIVATRERFKKNEILNLAPAQFCDNILNGFNKRWLQAILQSDFRGDLSVKSA